MANTENIAGKLTDGMIVTMFQDAGPENIYNSSPLNENEAFGMAIKHLAAVATHTPGVGEIYSFGPLPTPKRPYDTLAFVLHVKATDSVDVRLTQFGRVVVFWLVTKSSTTAKYTNVLKLMLYRLLRSYQVTTDVDLQQKEILEKIDKKLAIIETGMDTYYISEEKILEPFMDLALAPPKAPIVLIDNTESQIRVLFRDRTSASKIAALRGVVNDHKQKIPRGAAYRTEFISDPLESESILSKLGFMTQSRVSQQFNFYLMGKPSFEEFNELFASYLTPIMHQLVNQVLKSVESETALDLRELAKKTGISTELIEKILESAISKGFIENGKVENQTLRFS
ncbi:MAG: hypothetical protein ACFFB3_03205 [Candidatus Hodarchaeota archaeon]